MTSGRSHRALLLSTLDGVAGSHYILGGSPGRLAGGDRVSAAAYLKCEYHRNWYITKVCSPPPQKKFVISYK